MKAKRYNESLRMLQDSLDRKIELHCTAIENLLGLTFETREVEIEHIVNGLRGDIDKVFDETAFPTWYANEEI